MKEEEKEVEVVESTTSACVVALFIFILATSFFAGIFIGRATMRSDMQFSGKFVSGGDIYTVERMR